MKNVNHSRRVNNILSFIAVILLLIPISILALWISVFTSNPSFSQAEKLEVFLSNFPWFLRSVSSVSLVVIALCAGSIVFAIPGQKNAGSGFRIAGAVVIIIASVVLLLQVFTLL